MNADAETGHGPDEDEERRPDDQPDEGGSGSSASDKLPGAPAGDDDSPLGDTDQHSDA